MINFESYDRISDTLMYLTQNVTLTFCVRLAKSSKNGGRQFFAYETAYNAKKYNQEVRSIKRNMSYYFALENKQDFANGLLLMPQDIEILLMLIRSKILPWFFGSESQRAFKTMDDKLVLTEFTPVVYAKTTTKYIEFTPVVYSYSDSSYKEGIRMRIMHEIVDLDIDRFMGFINILKSDMYACACSMVAYAKTEPYGVNEFRMAGLGGGRVEDHWNDIPDNNESSKGNNKFGKNNFLDNAKKG